MLLQTVSTNINADGNFIDKVSTLFSQHGVYTSLFAFFLIIVIVLLYKAGSLYLSKENQKREAENENLKNENIKLREENAVNKFAEKENSNNIKISTNIEISEFRDLTKHSFFANTDYILDVKIKEVFASSENKKNIFTDYIYAKYKTSRDSWYDVIKSIDPDTINQDVLKSLLINTEKDSIQQCNKLLEGYRMPSNVSNRMKELTSYSDKMIISVIETYCESDYLENGFDIIYMILEYKNNVCDILFTHLLLNIERLNGTLEKSEYKSKINK